MNGRMLAAVLLIALGVAALAYQGITYTKTEKVVDFGPVEVTAENWDTIPLPPVVGIISLLAGIAIAVTGRKR